MYSEETLLKFKPMNTDDILFRLDASSLLPNAPIYKTIAITLKNVYHPHFLKSSDLE